MDVSFTKMIATLSPWVSDKEMLKTFITSGVDVFRLNFSHGTYEEYEGMIARIKEVREELQTPVAILQDLQGPRVRVGDLEEGVEIHMGETVRVSDRRPENGEGPFIPLDHDLSTSVGEGDKLLIEDGLITLKVAEVDPETHLITCESHTDATVKEHKGVNFPGNTADFPVITEKDQSDLAFGLEQGVDLLAMSFVRSHTDIERLRELMRDHSKTEAGGYVPPIIAKIEKPSALDNIERIVETVDGIMVARGDLGIEVSAEEVPVIQKNLINRCIERGKQVIVATQMLDSMIESPRPTRAEVSDVANAVLDHTDAVMLSGETSGGEYPVEAVQMMERIVEVTERSKYDDRPVEAEEALDNMDSLHKELAYGGQHLARKTEADGIVIFDFEGRGIAEFVSQFRTRVPVFVCTSDQSYYYQTALVWGVTGVYISPNERANQPSIMERVAGFFDTEEEESCYFVVIDISQERQEAIQVYMV